VRVQSDCGLSISGTASTSLFPDAISQCGPTTGGYDPEINLFGTNAGGIGSCRRPRQIAASISAATPFPRLAASRADHFLTLGESHNENDGDSVWALTPRLTLVACNLDLQNPNQPTEGQVTSSPDGVIALATGLQGRFAQSYGNYSYMAGLVTDEFVRPPPRSFRSATPSRARCHPEPHSRNVFNSIYGRCGPRTISSRRERASRTV